MASSRIVVNPTLKTLTVYGLKWSAEREEALIVDVWNQYIMWAELLQWPLPTIDPTPPPPSAISLLEALRRLDHNPLAEYAQYLAKLIHFRELDLIPLIAAEQVERDLPPAPLRPKGVKGDGDWPVIYTQMKGASAPPLVPTSRYYPPILDRFVSIVQVLDRVPGFRQCFQAEIMAPGIRLVGWRTDEERALLAPLLRMRPCATGHKLDDLAGSLPDLGGDVLALRYVFALIGVLFDEQEAAAAAASVRAVTDEALLHSFQLATQFLRQRSFPSFANDILEV